LLSTLFWRRYLWWLYRTVLYFYVLEGYTTPFWEIRKDGWRAARRGFGFGFGFGFNFVLDWLDLACMEEMEG
jgi:hypothetical protein